jgi:hypothetical protein
MSKIVTTGTGNKHLHENRECPRLKGTDEERIRDASGQEEEIRDECKICHVEIVECEFCGERYSIGGLGAHQDYCEENPDRIGAELPILD